jgi:hypothetical protein
MHKLNLRNSWVVAAMAAAAFCTQAAQGASISVTPASQTVNQGDPVSVDITVGGLGNGVAPALGAFDLIINFNPAVVALGPAGVSFSSRLGDPTNSGQTEVLPTNLIFPGELEIDETSLLTAAQLFALQSSATGDFVVATINFDTIASGTSTLSVTLPAGGLSDENGNDLTPSFTTDDATVTVNGPASVTPEPRTTALLLAAIGLLLVANRRVIKAS